MRSGLWTFCRLCLALACGLWAAFGLGLVVLGVAAVPQVLLLAAAAALYFRGRVFRGTGWAYGTARPESTAELLEAGHLREEGGLLLGLVRPPGVREAARLLVSAPVSESEAACRLFLTALARRDVWLRLRGINHGLVVSPTGAGKTTSVVLPQLLTDPTPMVVTDPKGEIARQSAAYRAREFGHQVVILDPWRLVTDAPDTLNPLDWTSPDDPRALDSLASLASDLVVRDEHERERHWNDSAELFHWAVASWVLHRAPPALRNLQTVAELLASPAELHTATQAMTASKAWGGMLARLGGQLQHFTGEERGSVLTTSNRHLKFLATPAVAESTACSSFDPHLRRGRPTTVYLVLPPEYQRSHAGLMRMWIGTILRACVADGTAGRGRVRFVLDEAASLGHMRSLSDAVAVGRGYSISLLFIYQSLGQLKLCYPDGQDQTFLSNMDCQVYFGPPNDWDTASRVSEMLGEATIAVAQESGGRSGTRNRDPQGLESSSTAWNEGYSVSETGRRLLRPEEVLTLPERTAIIFSRTTRPVVSRLVRHYEPEFRDAPGLRPGRRGAAWHCLALAAATFAAAAALVVEAGRKAREDATPPRPAWPAAQQYTPRTRW